MASTSVRSWCTLRVLCQVALIVLHLGAALVQADDFYELLDITRQASQKEIRQAFKKKALSMHPDKNTDDPDAHEKFLRINRAYEVLKDEDLRKKYDTHGEEGLKENAPSGGGYRSWKFYQQEFGLYDDDPNIITLSKSDFEVSVENTQDAWFINFYSPHCGHCHDLAPTWRELGQELDGVVRIGAVNCEDDWMLCRQQGIHSYPSLLMYPAREKFTGDRSRKELIRFALKGIKADVQDLWSGNFKAAMEDPSKRKHPWVISVCGEGGDCMQNQNVKKLAAMLADLVNVGRIDCYVSGELCSNLGVEYGTYFFPVDAVKKGAGKSVSSLDAKEVASSVLAQLPDVTQLDEASFETARRDLENHIGAPWLIHFINDDSAQLELRKLPALLYAINVGRVDCRLAAAQCNNLHIQKFPSFVLLKLGGGHEIHHGRVIAADIAAFARDSAQTNVVVLGPGDFPDPVLTSRQPWFVDFYAPWCPPCMRLLPEFRKASKRAPGRINFGTVDCTVHVSLCQRHNVRSYPTTIFYNQTVPHQFHGRHSAQAIVEFIEDTLNPPVLALDPHNFDEIVGRKGEHEMVLVDYFAPWCGPCQQLAPEWRKFAKIMAGTANVKVAHVDCQAHQDLCRAQGVGGYPTIRLYPMGSVGNAQFRRYEGWFRDAGSLRAWAFSFLPSRATILDNNNFANTVLLDTRPWVVDFYAPWCGHCQTFAPEFERVAQVMSGRVRAGKVNCDEHRFLCQQAGIRAYPSIRFYPGAKGHGQMQSFYGQDLNSQNGDYIISFLNQHVSLHQVPHDEL